LFTLQRYRTLHHNFKNHSSQLILYSYNQHYRLIALTVSNTVPPSQVHLSTHRALCSITVAVHLTLSRYHLHTLCFSLGSSRLFFFSVCQSYIVLIAHRQPSTRHWNILLECSLCCIHSSGNIWHSVSRRYLSGSRDVRGFVCSNAARGLLPYVTV
jgi:hypothetical protein